MNSERIKLSDKQKKYLIFLLVLAIVGIVFLSIPSSKEKVKVEDSVIVDDVAKNENIDAQLSEILSSVKGAGRVKVMVRVANSDEVVYEKNSKSTKVNASGNDNRVESSVEDSVAMQSTAKGNEALVVKTLTPEVIGVLIVAEGASSEVVKAQLVEAASVYLGIATFKVSVQAMKEVEE